MAIQKDTRSQSLSNQTGKLPLSAVIAELSIYFWTYKACILTIALLAPGVGYDTSTTLLPGANKLVKWDAIYFVQKSQRGDTFEQEWAFGKGLSTILSLFAGRNADAGSVAIYGIILAHISHYIAMILVYKITEQVSSHSTNTKSKQKPFLPFMAACLYVVAPAGIFLSAPYAEAPFAALNMLGYWLYLRARAGKMSTVVAGQMTMFSGIVFGLATVLRSNGLLSGIVFLVDAVGSTIKIVGDIYRGEIVISHVATLLATILGGLCVAAGLLLPQYIAYVEYCVELAEPRSWCNNRLPLIYSFVQSFYWYVLRTLCCCADKNRNVGFLRYWTLSNLPLFLLAAPTIYLLLRSCVFRMTDGSNISRTLIALPQLVLALLAITNYHVQVITRLASGYPLLYIWLAEQVGESVQTDWTVRYFIIYGLIQAGLFASFLPPA